jgi:serine/threonine-protein kinase HipA
MRKAEIYLYNRFAGILIEDENGYSFEYDKEYLANTPERLSVNLPLQAEKFHDKTLFPFFDGLIPEGWLLEIATDNWKLNPNDRMGLLLACCRDCIGATSVREVKVES